jgi:hypothetical protein
MRKEHDVCFGIGQPTYVLGFSSGEVTPIQDSLSGLHLSRDYFNERDLSVHR